MATTGSVILAIDLGKYKSVACAYDRASAQGRFETVDSTPEALAALLGRVGPAVVVIEACVLSGWVHDLCRRKGLACKVANTASEAWKFKHSKRKTDKDDALRLAQLEALGQLPAVHVPPAATRQWRALIAHRQALIGRRVAVQNRIRALLLARGLPAPRGAEAWARAGLEGIARHAKALAECAADELWRGLLELALREYRQVAELSREAEKKLDALAEADARVALLRTVPGVGPRTAEAVAAHLDDARRFRTGRQVSAYAGLVPRQYQSGESDRRGRVTRRGPGLLRKLLVECAWVMLRYNGWARQTYARLARGGARKKPAVVALARKLLVRCWAMTRDGAAWRAGPAEAPAGAAG